MSSWLSSVFRGNRQAAVRPTSGGNASSSSASQSMSSLTPSQLDRVIMDMLNIRNEGPALQRYCNDNPVTKAGKRMQVLRLLGTVMVPIVALLALVSSIFISQVQGYQATKKVQQAIRYGITLSELVYILQRERDLSALYVSAIGPETKTTLLRAYTNTDTALDSLAEWVTVDKPSFEFSSRDRFNTYLNKHRYNLDLSNPKPQDELTFYTNVMNTLMSWFYGIIAEAKSGSVWKDLAAMQEMLTARDAFGIERAMGAIFYIRGGFADLSEYRKYTEGYDIGVASLDAAKEFSQKLASKYEELLSSMVDSQAQLQAMRVEIRRASLRTFNRSLEKATVFFENVTTYMNLYLEMQNHLVDLIEVKLSRNLSEENQIIAILGTLFVFVLLICPVITRAVYLLTTDIQSYSMRLVDRTKALNKEKKRTDTLLYQMLPKAVADRLKKNGVVNAEGYPEVTIFFSDIVGFTSISARSSPIQVVNMLNSLYTCFDNEIGRHDVYKVETIGDAYMVASGLPQTNGRQHAAEIAGLSLDLMDQVADLVIPHMPGKSFRMRIGLNTGSVVAGVVGVKMPRYCLFGKAVGTASLMEANGEPGRIHMSGSTHAALEELGGFVLKERKDIVKELGGVKTYWLVQRAGNDVIRGTPSARSDSASPLYADQICVGKGYEEDAEDGGTLMVYHRSSPENALPDVFN